MTAGFHLAASVSHKRREVWIGLACVALVVAIWSGFQLLSRFGARSGMSAADLTLLRFGVSGAIMFPLLARKGLHGVPLPRAIVLMVAGGVGFSLLAFSGFAHAPASHGAALLAGSLPLFTGLAAMTLLGERFGPVKLLGLGLIVGGVACIGIDGFGHAGLDYWRGDLYFLAGALSWTLFTVACRAWRITPIQATVIVSTLSMIVYLPVYLLTVKPGFSDIAPSQILVQAIYHGVVSMVLTMFAYTRAIAALGAATTSMITAAVPGIVTLSAAPLLGEIPSPLALAGTALVTVGMVATVLTIRQAPGKP